MLQLFVKTGCRFSKQVRQKLEDEAIDFVEYNVTDPLCRDKVQALGGKVQTPFLVDTTKGIALFEARAIIEYLDENYVQANHATHA